jgi:hypothetical protein
MQAAREQGAIGAVYMSAADVPPSLAELPTACAPEGAPPPIAIDLGLAVAALLDTLRCVAALAGQLATGIGGGVAPPLVPFAPDARVSRRAISAPCAATSCLLAHHTDMHGGSGPSERVGG